MNKVSFPPIGGFLVVVNDVIPGTISGCGHIFVHPKANRRNGRWVSYPLLRGEWYEIKSITYPRWSVRQIEGGVPAVTLKLNRSKKGRAWCKKRMLDIANAEFDTEATSPTISIDFKATDLNDKTFLATTQEGAILCSRRVLGTAIDSAKVATWRYLEF